MEKTATVLGLIKQDCLDIQNSIAGIDKQEFLTNPLVNKAVSMSLFSIGELSKTLPADFYTSYPHLPWEKIISLNTTAHENKRLDLETVWAVAAKEVEEILSFIISYE